MPFAASASCRGNHPGHDGHGRGADVRRREFRPAASAAESHNRSSPDFMWRIGPTYLGVRAGGGLAKSWSQRLRIHGKPCNLGLGRYPIVTLAEARDKALRTRGRSPREASRATARVSLRSQAAECVIRLYKPTWRTEGAIAAAVAEPPLRSRPGYPEAGDREVEAPREGRQGRGRKAAEAQPVLVRRARAGGEGGVRVDGRPAATGRSGSHVGRVPHRACPTVLPPEPSS